MTDVTGWKKHFCWCLGPQSTLDVIEQRVSAFRGVLGVEPGSGTHQCPLLSPFIKRNISILDRSKKPS